MASYFLRSSNSLLKTSKKQGTFFHLVKVQFHPKYVKIMKMVLYLQNVPFLNSVIRNIEVLPPPQRAVTFPWWGGLRTSMTWIAMLAGVFILLLGPPKPHRLKDRGQTK